MEFRHFLAGRSVLLGRNRLNLSCYNYLLSLSTHELTFFPFPAPLLPPSIRVSGQELHRGIRASGQECEADPCFWAGISVSLGRNIRASGQEYPCFWAGTSVLLGRKFAVSPYGKGFFLP